MDCKTNHEGNPTNALIVQGIVVSVLLIIPALGIGNMDSFLQMLINMTAATSLLPVLLLLIGYIVLRWKKTIWIEALDLVVEILVSLQVYSYYLYSFSYSSCLQFQTQH